MIHPLNLIAASIQPETFPSLMKEKKEEEEEEEEKAEKEGGKGGWGEGVKPPGESSRHQGSIKAELDDIMSYRWQRASDDKTRVSDIIPHPAIQPE